MKKYFKTVLNNLVDLLKGLLYCVIIIIAMCLLILLLDKSFWFILIPIIGFIILITFLFKVLNKNKTFIELLLMTIVSILIALIVFAIVIGVFVLCMWLIVKVSYLFVIPILIIGFLIYSYCTYKEEE